MLPRENLEWRRRHWGKDISERRMISKGHGARKVYMNERIIELEFILEIICGLITSFPR